VAQGNRRLFFWAMMMNRSTALAAGLLVLRVAVGGFMLVHGWQKLTAFNELADVFPDPIGMGSQLSLIAAIGAEVGCSLLLVVGLATRLAALPLAFTMIIALLVVHGADPWQKKELAAIYLSIYVAIGLMGPGRFSLDAIVKSKCDKRSAN
jgi:putative oxidoreductase